MMGKDHGVSPPLGFLASMPGFSSKSRVLPNIPDHVKSVNGRRTQLANMKSPPVKSCHAGSPALPPVYDSQRLQQRQEEMDEMNGFNALQVSLNKLLSQETAVSAPEGPSSLDEKWAAVADKLELLHRHAAEAPDLSRAIYSTLDLPALAQTQSQGRKHKKRASNSQQRRSCLPEVLACMDLLFSYLDGALPGLDGALQKVRTHLFLALRLKQCPERPGTPVDKRVQFYRKGEEALHREEQVRKVDPTAVVAPAPRVNTNGRAVSRTVDLWQKAYLEWVFEKWREVTKFSKILRKVAHERDDLRGTLRQARRSIIDIEARGDNKEQWDGLWKLQEAQKEAGEKDAQVKLLVSQRQLEDEKFCADREKLSIQISEQNQLIELTEQRIKETTSVVRDMLPATKPPDEVADLHRVIYESVYQNDVDRLKTLLDSQNDIMKSIAPNFDKITENKDAKDTTDGRNSNTPEPEEGDTNDDQAPKRQRTATFADTPTTSPSSPPLAPEPQPESNTLVPCDSSFPGDMPTLPHIDLHLGVGSQELYDMLGTTQRETAAVPNTVNRAVVLLLLMQRVVNFEGGQNQLLQHKLSMRRCSSAHMKQVDEEKKATAPPPVFNEIVENVSKALRFQAEKTKICVRLVQSFLWDIVVKQHREDGEERSRRVEQRRLELGLLRELSVSDDDQASSRAVMNEAVERIKPKVLMEEQDEVYLRDVLESSKARLMDIYRYYASSDHKAMDTVLSKEELDAFLQDCNLEGNRKKPRRGTVVTPRRKSSVSSPMKSAGDEKEGSVHLMPVDFVEHLLNYAAQRRDGKRLYQSFASMMETNVQPSASFVCSEAFRKQVFEAETQAELKAARQGLFGAYQKYSYGNKNGLDWKGFKKMLDDYKVADESLSHYTMQQVFIRMKATAHLSTEVFKSYAEFQVDLCVLAVYRMPAPFIPLSVKTRSFIEWFLRGDVDR